MRKDLLNSAKCNYIDIQSQENNISSTDNHYVKITHIHSDSFLEVYFSSFVTPAVIETIKTGRPDEEEDNNEVKHKRKH